MQRVSQSKTPAAELRGLGAGVTVTKDRGCRKKIILGVKLRIPFLTGSLMKLGESMLRYLV